MAASPASRRLIGLCTTLLFVLSADARATDDAAHPVQEPAGVVVASVEVESPRPTPPVEIPAAAPPPAPLPPPSTPAAAPPPTADAAEDMAPVKAAVDAYRRGALAEGDELAKAIDDRGARAMLEWVAIRYGGGAIDFARINAFFGTYPDYPATPIFRRRAEEALIAEKKGIATIRSFFAGQRPVSPAGRIALARVLRADGKASEAAALIRETWRRDHLGIGLERLVLAEFGEALTQEDHRLRTERYLFREQAEAALRNAARISNDYVKLAQARLASAKAKGTIAPKLIAAIPASLRDELSFVFLQAQQARRANRTDEAAQLLAKSPRDPALLGDGDEWWIERRLIARRLLDGGEPARAYAIAAAHGAEDAAERIDAEWHAGFIALRFRDQPGLALAHFGEAAKLAEAPISVSRAAYWQGRAAEAMGKAEDARAFFEQAAAHPVAYYGQLARAKLGMTDLPVRGTEPADLADLPWHRGAELLYRMGARELGATMLIDLAQRLDNAPALESVAAIARRENDIKALLTIGKLALQRGFPLDAAAFPTFGVPEFPVLGDPMERAIVHAIARQESAFDPSAVSPAGARGLMQMMPATARETARRANMPFDLSRLGQDALYSAQMGAAHLNDLLKDWRGSYILTFAAYNAGSGNVKKWIDAYGDPRDPRVDAVDWVERIPFYETRNYVQRVMENLQVYRQRLDQRTAYLIDYDLKRGAARE